jgi:hypothetical protein
MARFDGEGAMPSYPARSGLIRSVRLARARARSAAGSLAAAQPTCWLARSQETIHLIAGVDGGLKCPTSRSSSTESDTVLSQQLDSSHHSGTLRCSVVIKVAVNVPFDVCAYVVARYRGGLGGYWIGEESLVWENSWGAVLCFGFY